MILLADSGSTKTDWCLAENGKALKSIKTRGTNPFFQTEDEIAAEIEASLLPELPSTEIDDVFFYGAGCTAEKQPVLEPGIACILGTGSNSCLYDGEKLVKNVSPLGFILGDEGSGAVLGKNLVGDILKCQLPEHIRERFHEKFQLTGPDIIERVYRQKLPNRFLASLVPFLAENISDESIDRFVVDNFRRFLTRNVKLYESWDKLPVGFNGSIAFYFRPQLEKALKAEGMTLGRIIKAPMEGLIEYHK